MVKKYIKNSILHPLSLLGVFFVLIALLFSASTLYKSMNHAKEIQRRDKITAEVSKASHVITKKRHGRFGNRLQKYIQNFDVTYQYSNKKYTVSYRDFNLGKPEGYQKGDCITVYIKPDHPSDAIASAKLFTDTTGVKQLFCLFGIPGLIIILFPKAWMEQNN